jgi:hypothetical protein
LTGNENGPTLGVDAARPSDLVDQFGRAQEFTSSAIQNIKEPVPIGMQDNLPHLAANLRVDQHRPALCIPVVRVMRRELEVPLHFAGIEVQRNEGAGIKIVAFASGPSEIGPGIACCPIERVQFGIEGA